MTLPHQKEEEEDEAFVGINEGEIADGDVLDDLNDEDVPDFEESDGDDMPEDAGDDQDREMLDDDSLHAFEGHQEPVLAVAWSPAHPDLVATGGQDDKAFVWRVGQDAYEATAGTLSTYELSGHTDTVVTVRFNASGTLLASAGMDGTVKVWGTGDGQLKQTLEGPGGSVDWMSWHPKGDVVLAGSEDFTMWMWLAQTGACMQVFSGHNGPVVAGAFTPDGKAVVSIGGEDDCSLRAWNPKTGECTAVLQRHPFHEEALTCLDIAADSSTVLTGAQDGSLILSNISTQRIVGHLRGHEDSIESAGFSRHLPLAASGSMDGKMIIWDCGNCNTRGTCAHPEGITRLAWHPHQPLVFTGCMDGVVRCWDLRTGACVKKLGGHREPVQDLAVSPDGSMIISGSDDNTARVFQWGQ